MKKELLKHFTDAAAGHVKMAKCSKAISGHFAALAECVKAAKSEMKDGDEDAAAHYLGASGEFAAHSSACADLADNCLTMCDVLKGSMKVEGDDEDALEPSRIFKIAPSAPQKLTAVPRFGSRPVPAATDDEIQKIFSTGTDE